MTTNVVVVVGTRPEFVKMATVVQALNYNPTCRCDVVFTNQHPDLGPMAAASLDIEISYALPVLPRGRTMTQLLGHMVHELATAVPRDTDLMVVQGDTLSALAGSLVAELRLIPLVHVEAGVRSGVKDDPFPEEISRRLISQVADLHLCFNEPSRMHLVAEGQPPETIRIVPHPLRDHVTRVSVRSDSSPPGVDLLVTLHRRERRQERLEALPRILEAARNRVTALRSLFVWHPGLVEPHDGWADSIRAQGCEIADPLDPVEFLDALSRSRCVLTDSAGVAEEAQLLGVPLAVFRTSPESRMDSAPVAPTLSSEDVESLASFLAEQLGGPISHTTLPTGLISSAAGDQIAKEILSFVER